MGKIEKRVYYTYNDLTIKPGIISDIKHRSECNPYDEEDMLPLFTAPMDTVVDKKNFNMFEENKIHAILPRTESVDDRIAYACDGKWAAFSLQEFEKWFTDETAAKTDINKIRALIDIANGHVERLYTLVRKSKEIFGTHIEVMVGNIANPDTYRACVESQVDYVRCSVGTGAGCITCSNTAIGYPIASLISEIAEIKEEYIKREIYDKDSLPKIIADGGIRNYNDIIKAIVLGADYVMCGSIFSKMLESASVKVMDRGVSDVGKKIRLRFPIEHYENLKYEDGGWIGDYTDEFIEEMAKNGHKTEKENHVIGTIYAKFYGMASRAGQIAMKGKKVHTSEGIEKMLEVTYTIKTWVENMTDYLQSAMSYTNSRTLDELKQASVVIVSMNTYNSINK
jgi:IMP dehydrogenase/GMP reductase